MTKSFYKMNRVLTKYAKNLMKKTSKGEDLSNHIGGMCLIIEMGRAYNGAGGFLGGRDS